MKTIYLPNSEYIRSLLDNSILIRFMSELMRGI